MKTILLLVALCAASSAFAADVSFNVAGFRSEMKNGITLVTISDMKEDGTVSVTYDPNRCDPSGGCTRIRVFRWEGKMTVISDQRGSDGYLTLGLTDRVMLEVSAGFSIDRKVHYTAIVAMDPRNPDGPVARVPLTADVFTDVR